MAGLSLFRGVWHVTYYKGKRRCRKSTGFPEDQKKKAATFRDKFIIALDEAEKQEVAAKEAAEKEEAAAKADPFRKYRVMTLAEHIADYNVSLAASSPGYVKAVNKRLFRFFNQQKLTSVKEVTPFEVEAFVTSIRSSQRVKKGAESKTLGPATRNKYRKTIAAFANWMFLGGRIPEYPLRGLKYENEEVEVRRPRIAFTEEQFIALHDAAMTSAKTVEGMTGPDRARLYLVAASTGLRRKELASLTKESFRLAALNPTGTVAAAHSKHKRLDTIPLPKSLLPLLVSWLATLQPGEPLFPRLAKRKTDKMIKRDLKAAGLSHLQKEGCLDFHSTRHLFISRVARSGAPPIVIRDLARHDDFKTTQRYITVEPEELRSAVDSLPDLLGGKKKRGRSA